MLPEKSFPLLKFVASLFLFHLTIVGTLQADSPGDRIDEAIAQIEAAAAGDAGGEAVGALLRRFQKEGRIKVGDLKGNHGEYSDGPDGLGEITVDSDLINDPLRLISTLIHEALHALDGYVIGSFNFPGMIQAIIDHIDVYLEQVRLLRLVIAFFDDDDVTEYIECIINEILNERIPQLLKELEAWLKRVSRNSSNSSQSSGAASSAGVSRAGQ